MRIFENNNEFLITVENLQMLVFFHSKRAICAVACLREVFFGRFFPKGVWSRHGPHVAVAGIDERIEVFKGCLKCVNTVSLTEFTPEFDVAFSTLEHVEAMTTFMWVEAQGQNFDDAVANMERTFSGSSKPKVFVNLLGMAWISDEWFEDGALKRIFMLGPVFLDDYSVSNLEKKLDKLQISIALKHRFMRYIFSTPILSLRQKTGGKPGYFVKTGIRAFLFGSYA